MNHEIAKGIAYIGASGAIAIVDGLEGLPSIIKELGLPVAFSVCAIYGMVLIHRQCRLETAGRLDDTKDFAARMEKQVEASAESRAKLIEVTEKVLSSHEINGKQVAEINIEQLKAQAKTVAAIEKLAAELHQRPCQKS